MEHSWEGLGEGLNGSFSEIQQFEFNGNDIYVVGNFTSVGNDAAFNNIAKWNGNSWEKLGYGFNQESRAIAFYDGELFVGGSFTSEGPGGVSNINYLAKWIGPATDVKNSQTSVNKFSLEQNYPNPFNPTTKIKYSIPNVGDANLRPLQTTLRIYNILGKEVATLVNEQKHPGAYEVTFDGKNLSSGVYLYQLKVNNSVDTKKLILLK